jgi:hypothetical protein
MHGLVALGKRAEDVGPMTGAELHGDEQVWSRCDRYNVTVRKGGRMFQEKRMMF